MNSHRQHCTCPNCSKTGMTMTEQAAFCNGKGQRLIGAPDRPEEVRYIINLAGGRLFETMQRMEMFGHYPN
jgi:hypothetical protein